MVVVWGVCVEGWFSPTLPVGAELRPVCKSLIFLTSVWGAVHTGEISDMLCILQERFYATEFWPERELHRTQLFSNNEFLTEISQM